MDYGMAEQAAEAWRDAWEIEAERQASTRGRRPTGTALRRGSPSSEDS
jgi:hypothetical protein